MSSAAVVPQDLRPLRREEYERMVALGMFGDEAVELVHGMLLRMSPQGHRHLWTVTELARLLVRGLPEDVRIPTHSPLAAGDHSEPEPDLYIVDARAGRSAVPSEALLVVEVADSSLRRDSGVKRALYATVGVPTYWLVDLIHDEVHVHTEPRRDGSWGRIVTVDRAGMLTVDPWGLELRVADFLVGA